MNTNGPNKDIYIGISSNILDFPAKVIFSANQIHVVSTFYDDKRRKLGGNPVLVTTEGREIFMLISDRLDYLPVRCPTN